jgi:acyl-homoserine-lactone acylase
MMSSTMDAPRRAAPALALAGAALLAVLAAPAPADRPLSERVVIRRDTFRVPHVLAEDEEAAAFGLGFAMAEDHAAEMGRRYLAARGESARHFGEEGIEDDFAALRLDTRWRARRALQELGDGFRRWLTGFTAGYNRYVVTHRAELPAWVPRVDPADVLAHTRADAMESSLRPPRALLEKYPARAPAPPPEAGGPPGPEAGSNALALAGSRTTTGHAILLGNPHLRWSSLYWEAHVTVPGRLDFYGSTLVGLPMLRAGFNDRLGYVQTNNHPDLADILALPLDPLRPGYYLFDGRTFPIRSRRFTVQVDQEDGSLRSVSRDFDETHLGPVVHRTADRVFAVRSAALEGWRHFEGFYELAHARSLREYLRVMRRGLFVTRNFIYADADGHVSYLWNASLPRRKEPGDYSLDVPGESRFLWKGVHPVDELPQLLDPPHGYVQNANNPPWFTSLSDPIDPARFPAYVERGPLELRPQVVLEALDGDRRFSPDDVRQLKFTTRVLLAERVLPDLLAAARRVPAPSPALASGIEVL